MKQESSNIFRELGRISQPYEEITAQTQQMLFLQQENYLLKIRNQQLHYQLQATDWQLEAISNHLYILADSLSKKESKKIYHLIDSLERQKDRVRSNNTAYSSQFDLAFLFREGLFTPKLPKRGEVIDYDFPL